MKKLLVTAIGAAAAFGAIAGEISRQAIGEFDSTGPVTTNELNQTLGNYWSELPGSTNTYTVSELASVGTIATPIDPISGKALDVKTTFGKPLSVDIVAGGTPTNIPNSGLYFDSLVKFTVCEETPDQEYSGAKIIMWLQEQYEGDNVTGTNLWVRAGYLTTPGNVVETNYLCGTTIDSDFADKWHRITIKAMADITVNGGLGHTPVPGFAIFIDSTRTVISDESKWAWADGAYPLTEAAEHYGESALFPSMIQDQQDGNKGSLTCASFDGTGSLTDIVFTDDAPIDIAEDYVAPKASIINDATGEGITGSPFASLEAAVDAVNGLTSGTYTFSLSKGLVLDAPLEFASSANITFDFAGKVLTNTTAYCAITNKSGAITFVDSGIGGGITCTDSAAGAIYVSGATGTGVTIEGGVFRSTVAAIQWTMLQTSKIHITGGSFEVTTAALENRAASEGKVFKLNELTSLYDVVDATYTVKYVYGLNQQTTNVTANLSKDAETPLAPDAAVAGYTYVWSPEPASTVSADATYTAVYTAVDYTITYLNEDGSAFTQWADNYAAPASYTVERAVTLPTASDVKLTDVGVEFGGWTNATGTVTGWAADEQTGDVIVYAKLDPVVPTEYTITFVNEIGDDPASTNYTIASGTITLPEATTSNMGVQFDGWTNATITTAIKTFTPTEENVGNFTLYAAWSSTGTGSFDGGAGNTFSIDPSAQATVVAATGCESLTDTVPGSTLTYAQAYALGLIDAQGDVAELDATIEMKDGNVVVGLSSTPLAAYTITLKVYEKASLTAAWPAEPTQTYTLDSTTATTGFSPGSAGAGFYKTEITISNK